MQAYVKCAVTRPQWVAACLVLHFDKTKHSLSSIPRISINMHYFFAAQALITKRCYYTIEVMKHFNVADQHQAHCAIITRKVLQVNYSDSWISWYGTLLTPWEFSCKCFISEANPGIRVIILNDVTWMKTERRLQSKATRVQDALKFHQNVNFYNVKWFEHL